MTEKNRNILVGGILALIIVVAAYLSLAPGGANERREVERLVTDFGRTMQSVSLLGPDASSTLKVAYGDFVVPELLRLWQQDTQRAPGRSVSSPWPDHIDVTSITPQGSGYIVHGVLVYATSAGATSTGTLAPAPVIVQVVEDEEGNWKIAAFEMQRQ